MLSCVLKRYFATTCRSRRWSDLLPLRSGVSACAVRVCLQPGYRPPSLLLARAPGAHLLGARTLHSTGPSHQQRRGRREEEEPPKRELDLLRYDMKRLLEAPRPALILGFSGLLPFVSAPMAMAATQLYLPEVAFAQVAYGACILSFLGGARWGFALPEGSPAKPDWLNLANSVVPALLAWVALLFGDNLTEANLMVIMGLGIALHYDLALLPTYPSWFKAMRTVLTLVATFSLVATLILTSVYPEKRLSAQKK